MRTLHDFFDGYVRGSEVALIHDDGFRRWSCTHDDVRRAAEEFGARLRDAGVQPGDRIAIWSENRPEWVVAFWGCLLQGVAVIPIDQRASPALARRLVAAGEPRGVLVGDGVPAAEWPSSLFVWTLRDVARAGARAVPGPLAGTTSGVGPARVPVTPDTVAEIVFTSGTTGDPKGVLITHRNILANITAIEPEAKKYAPYLLPLRPLRFLSLLPLSHMFGQALTMFLPPLVRAGAVFVRGYNPDEIVAQIRRHRITLVVTVPRVLEMLRGRVRHLLPQCAAPRPAGPLLARLWRYRAAHRLFWWRFCGFVVGGAQLDEGLEEFWRRLGFAVIQGYGLTETAPIIAWNHPFKIKHGTVGTPLGDAEIRIAGDGEVLVRGLAVTSGYLNAPEKTREAFEGGWFHTGDVGSFDPTGHLRIRGRKKDVIVASEGVKVFPEDVERVLDAVPGVREAAVVGRRANGAEHVHAVLVLARGAEPAAVVRTANTSLESHQRIQEFSVWPGAALPRTEAIRKLKHHEIRRWVEEGAGRPAEPIRETGDAITRLLSRHAGNRPLGPEMTLDDMGLTSLDRIELMTTLEDESGVALNETDIGSVRTVADLRRVVEAAAAASGRAPDAFAFPSWQRARLARLVRDASLPTWILPPARMFFRLHVDGREHLDAVRGPVIFAANHQSHFDIPVVLAALPGRWRRRVAVPAWKEYFDAHFFPERHTVRERLPNSAAYYLIALFFNAFPLPVTEPGMRQTLRYIGDLASEGVSILIFPEGERTDRGEIKPFQPGVGLMASKLRLPVIPIRLEGVDRVLHRTWNWPRRGAVTVTFGAPITLEGSDYAALARQVERAVVALRPRGQPVAAASCSSESSSS